MNVFYSLHLIVDPLLEMLPEKFINPETGELTLEILLPNGMLMNLVAEPQILVETLKGFIIDQVRSGRLET